jgi:hypothetical protein
MPVEDLPRHIAKHSTYGMELTELQMVRINSWLMSCLTLVSVGIRLKPSASALLFPGRYLMLKSASGFGLGAVLYQEQQGEKRVICYASRGLTKAEENYPPHKLELLVLKWVVADKFKDYLYMVRMNSWLMSCLTLVSVCIRLKPSASALFFQDLPRLRRTTHLISWSY